jgi:5'-nucleotidase
VLRGPVTIQFLNVSDWHGTLDPTNGIAGAPALSTYWKADRLAHPSLTLTAGDDFGATPPLSGFFEEKPAVIAQRMMGIQVGTFGNHNFDRGIAHLQQMINLAGAPTSAAAPGTPFKYVSANLQGRDGPGGLTGVEDFAMFDVGEVKVAVVGVTNPEAPSLVLPGNFGPIVPQPAAPAAMAAQAAARAAGADVVVAIGHLGVRGFTDGQPFGELIDFANAVSGFDVIFGDHTDIQFSGMVNGQLVHENRSFGVTYAKTLLTINPSTGEVLGSSASFVTPTAAAVTPDPAIVAMLAPIRADLAEILDVPIGVGNAVFPRGGNVERGQEVAIGNLVADGMRWKYSTQLGYMNSGGLRQSLPATNYEPADHTLRRLTPGYAAGPPFDLVLGDVYSVLPFNNAITTRTVTGDQLWAMLENGVSRINSATGLGTDGRFPQISGFKFTFDYGNATGCTGTVNTPSWECSTASRVISVAVNDGTPILPDGTTYTMALPNFVNLGGDNYTMLNDGQGTSLESDAVVMHQYMTFLGSPFTPVIDGRITKQP